MHAVHLTQHAPLDIDIYSMNLLPQAEAEDDYDGTTEDEAVSTDLSAPSTPRGGATGPGAATEPHKHGRRTRKVLKKIKAAFTPHHSDATA